MEEMLRNYEEKINERSRISCQIKDILSLEYDLLCLNNNVCVDYILAVLKSKDTEKTASFPIPSPHAMEVEMVTTVGNSLGKEEKADVISKLEIIQNLNLDICSCEDGLKGKFKYLYGLLQDDLFFKFAIEVRNFSPLVRVTPSEMMKYGIKTYGFPLLGQHPLAIRASPENQEKILRKLCYKISIAIKLDLCESSFEIDLYKQIEDILNRLESSKKKAGSPLPTPLSRKATRRGGLRTKRKRKESFSPRKRKFSKLEADMDADSS